MAPSATLLVRAGCTWALLGLAAACGGARKQGALQPTPAAQASSQRSGAGGAAAVLSPARVFPPSERAEVTAESVETDGSRRFVAQGLRIIERPDGSLHAADEFLPAAKSVAAVELPRRLGGGFLFVVNAGGSALFYGAPSFTGKLRPIGRFDGEVERVVPGFDRLYVLRARGVPWVALDPTTGRELDLGSLPPSPGYGAMAFADEWLAAVELPLRGVLATFDAGQSWHPLELPRAALAVADAGVLVQTESARSLLGPLGSLTPVREPELSPNPTAAAERRSQNLPAPPAERPLGPRPLELAVLHGYPARDGTALVAAGGMLARVRLRDGALLQRTPDAYPGAAPCDAVALGAGAGFVCGEARGATTVYALSEPWGLRPVLSFAGPRRLAESGRGALVVVGSCSSEAEVAEESVRCIVPAAGEPYAITLRTKTERVVALADGRAALLEPPRPGGSGSLSFVGRAGLESKLPLTLPKTKSQLAQRLLGDGFWLDGLREGARGELLGWILGGSSFAGVRVGRDGRVEVGEIQPGLDRALLNGRFGLLVGRGGSLLETIDGGFEWTEAELPFEPELKAQRTFGLASGCSALGCAVAGMLRVGWGMPSDGKLPTAAPPEPLRLAGAGGGRWSLDCSTSGEASRRSLPVVPEGDSGAGPWNPLGEMPAPARGRSELGFDSGSEAELRLFRAYAYGPPGDAWSREGRLLVRVRDPYRVGDAIWSTAASPVPWARSEATADALGRSAMGPPSSLRIVVDPVKHAGLLVLGTKGQIELYALEEGRRISRLKTNGAFGVITSMAIAGGRTFVGAVAEQRMFRVYRVEQGTLELVAEYPNAITRAEPPSLAPATRGEGIGLWVKETHSYLYPMDPVSGRLDTPLVARASELSAMPAPCNPDEDGYVVADALAVEPNVSFYGESDATAVGNGLEVRLIASPSRVCADAVAAPLGTLMAGGISSSARRTDARAPSRDAITSRNRSASDEQAQAREEEDAKRRSAGVRLVLNAPDGSRRGFRCRD